MLRDRIPNISLSTDLIVAYPGETEEDCTAQANGIVEFAKPSAYPVIRDGGEVSATQKATPKDAFVDWFNKIAD